VVGEGLEEGDAELVEERLGVVGGSRWRIGNSGVTLMHGQPRAVTPPPSDTGRLSRREGRG